MAPCLKAQVFTQQLCHTCVFDCGGALFIDDYKKLTDPPLLSVLQISVGTVGILWQGASHVKGPNHTAQNWQRNAFSCTLLQLRLAHTLRDVDANVISLKEQVFQACKNSVLTKVVQGR